MAGRLSGKIVAIERDALSLRRAHEFLIPVFCPRCRTTRMSCTAPRTGVTSSITHDGDPTLAMNATIQHFPVDVDLLSTPPFLPAQIPSRTRTSRNPGHVPSFHPSQRFGFGAHQSSVTLAANDCVGFAKEFPAPTLSEPAQYDATESVSTPSTTTADAGHFTPERPTLTRSCRSWKLESQRTRLIIHRPDSTWFRWMGQRGIVY